jgi:hypothetical protein
MLPPSKLTLTRDVTLQRAGNGFILVGVEGDEVRWASLSMEGVLGTESSLTLPARMVRPEPWFGAAAKSGPGDQLIVAHVVPKPGAANQLQVQAITQTAGAPASAPVVLFDLPAGVDPKIVRMAMNTTRTGQRAVLAWGFEGQDASPSFVLLGADAQAVAPPAAVHAGNLRWSCLQIAGSLTDTAVTFTEAGAGSAPPFWRAYELNDDGSRGSGRQVGLDVTPTGCVASAPSPQGYVLAYQNNDGTFFAEYIVDKSVVNATLVAGVLEFGGLARQPKVACVAPMGSEYSLLFDVNTGGEVWRINAFGSRQGAPLVLPSVTGQVGPVSAQPGKDVFFATYLDENRTGAVPGPTDGNATGNGRFLVRVDCPLAAPFTPAGGVDAGTVDAGK